MTTAAQRERRARIERRFFRLGTWTALAWWVGATVYVITKIRAAESQRALSPQVWEGVIDSTGLAFAGSVVTFLVFRGIGQILARRTVPLSPPTADGGTKTGSK